MARKDNKILSSLSQTFQTLFLPAVIASLLICLALCANHFVGALLSSQYIFAAYYHVMSGALNWISPAFFSSITFLKPGYTAFMASLAASLTSLSLQGLAVWLRYKDKNKAIQFALSYLKQTLIASLIMPYCTFFAGFLIKGLSIFLGLIGVPSFLLNIMCVGSCFGVGYFAFSAFDKFDKLKIVKENITYTDRFMLALTATLATILHIRFPFTIKLRNLPILGGFIRNYVPHMTKSYGRIVSVSYVSALMIAGSNILTGALRTVEAVVIRPPAFRSRNTSGTETSHYGP